MYISCYDENETNFEHNGEFKVFVDENENNIFRQLNGQFYATFKVSLTDRHIHKLLPLMYVKIPTPSKKNKYQLFKIFDLSDDDTGITFTAYQFVWGELSNGFIPHLNSVAKTRLEAAQYILDKAQDTKPHRCTVVDLEPSEERKNLQIVRYNPLVALMGNKENTILNRYSNVEFDFNNFEIQIQNRVGEDTGFVIRDDKNMERFLRDLDYKPVATRIIPQGANELLLPEYFLDSPNIAMYSEVYYKHVEFPEIGVDEANGVMKEDAINLLREAGMKLFTESKIDLPVLSWTITFDDGQNNPKISDELKELLKLDIGDSVIAIKRGLRQRTEARMMEYNYNFVKGEYTDITISSASPSYTVTIEKTVANINVKVDSFKSIITDLSEDMYSKIEQLIDEINLKVAKEDLSAEIEVRSDAVNMAINNGQNSNGIKLNDKGLGVLNNEIMTILLNSGVMNVYNSRTGEFMGYYGTVDDDLRVQLFGANTFSIFAGNDDLKILSIDVDRDLSYGNATVDICGGLLLSQRPGQNVGVNGLALGNDDRSDKYGYHNMSILCWNSLGIQDNNGLTNGFYDARRGRWVIKGGLYQNTESPPAAYILSLDEDHPFFCGKTKMNIVDSILNLETTIKVDNDGDLTMMILPNDDDLVMTDIGNQKHIDQSSIVAGLVEVVKSLNSRLKDLENLRGEEDEA
ncbi:phage tail spike protein [uncultured Turicibacter sp.]|uniref:phage tail spike protein n=1 Tax=uncultured Turicibacter sp. TaxID=297316 RepID=UPI00259907AB|nr:phage tail spike protein [uncultured Turicibacter sp.]